MQDYRRNGCYALGGMLMTAGTAWLVGWGVAVGTAPKGSRTHFWVPATIGAIAVLALGLLIIIAVMFDWPSKLRKRIGKSKEPEQVPAEPATPAPPLPPPTTTLLGGQVTDRSHFQVDTSADQFAQGTTFSGDSVVTGRHFPGRPDLLGEHVGSDHGQGTPPEESSETGSTEADGAADSEPGDGGTGRL